MTPEALNRSLHLKAKSREQAERGVAEPAANAGGLRPRLVKYGCCTAALVLLVGTPGASWAASSCCREVLFKMDCWIWGVVALATLGYFRFLAEPSTVYEEQEAYRPLNTTDENPREVAIAALAAVPPEESPSRAESATESTRSTNLKEPDPEPQQPIPTNEMCVQTDPANDEDDRRSVYSKGSGTSGRRQGSGNFGHERPMPIPMATGLFSTMRHVLAEQYKPRQLTHGKKGQGVAVAPDREEQRPVNRLEQAGVHQAPVPLLADEEIPAGILRENSRGASAPQTAPPLANGTAPTFRLPAAGPVAGAPAQNGEGQDPRDASTPRSGREAESQTLIKAPAAVQPAEDAPKARCSCAALSRCCGCLLVVAVLVALFVAVSRFDPELVASFESSPEVQNTEKHVEPELEPVVQRVKTGLQETENHVQSTVGSICTNYGGALGTNLCKAFRWNFGQDHSNMAPQWHTSEWSTCSEECGTGEAQRMVYCIYGNFADCLRQTDAPSDRKPCKETRGCKWHIGQWGRCDTMCGTGTMIRQVACAAVDGSCGAASEGTPPTRTACSRADGCVWEVGAWGECDNSCGHGKRHRDISCKNGLLDDCLQKGNRPADSEPCQNYGRCRWDPLAWTPCSNTCGRGIEERNLSCANGDQEACNHLGTAPRVQRACHDVSGCYWQPSAWSVCSSTCGEGTQTREIQCANGDAEECLENSMMPAKTQTCHSYVGCQWTVGPWSDCLAECGTGHMVREISCMNGQTSDCHLGPMGPPEETRQCINVTGCQWRGGPWGPCSNVCGEGRQFRLVECANGREEDCMQNMEPPANGKSCKDIMGCTLKGLPRCACDSSDTGLVAAGVLNAISGWIVSFTILHEMVNRANVGGNVHQATATLLSPPAVLIAGIGALAASSLLRSGAVLVDVNERHVVLDSSHLSVGLVGLALWLVSVCGAGGRTGSKQVHFTSAFVLLGFCALVLYMAAGSSVRGVEEGCTGPGCRGGARRLRGGDFLLELPS